LNDPSVREQYLENHVDWFLKNHQNHESCFMQEVEQKYPNRPKQKSLLFRE
jgi:site-specific DNA-methyltransferase (adenine-specific)